MMRHKVTHLKVVKISQCFLMFLCALPVFAQVDEAGPLAPVPEQYSVGGPDDIPPLPPSRDFEEQPVSQQEIETRAPVVRPRRLNIGYGISAISFPFPFRRGPHIGYAVTQNTEIGAQYMKDRLGLRFGGVHFGGAQETFWSVQGRWFPWEHFNMSFGLGQRKVRFNFLSKQLATLINQESAAHHIDIDNLIADVGFSHRWVNNDGLTFQADWVTVSIPISRSRVSGAPIDALTDERLRRGTERAASILGRAPSVALLGASVGWAF